MITKAVDAGVALYKACAELGISKRTYNRWKNTDSDYIDKHMACIWLESVNKMTPEEKHASELVKRIYRDEKICIGNLKKEPLVLHSDNGRPMKGATMLETLYTLGITPSKNRHQVSNDDLYAECLLKTVK